MNWVNKQKLPAVEAIKNNSYFYLKIEDLWQALHLSFNGVQDHQINISILDEISDKFPMSWVPFSKLEFTSSIIKCNNSLSLDSDKLIWRYLKYIIKYNMCLKKIVNIADMCFELGHWPLHFKVSTFIIIPKPNKKSYDFPKVFRPIVFLNTIGELIEKVISERLQFQLISNNSIYSSQLGSLK